MKRRKLGYSTDGAERSTNSEAEPEVKLIKRGKCHSGKVQKGSFEHRFERRRYLNQLVQEFQTTTVMECKQQVLANLANFGYDPYNYHFFQQIGVISVFLAELSVNRNETLTEFAMAGVCNCSADRRIQKEILRKEGLPIVKRHVHSSSSISTLLSAVTTLINFVSSWHDGVNIKDVIVEENFKSRLVSLLEHDDKRIKNVVQVLLDEL